MRGWGGSIAAFVVLAWLAACGGDDFESQATAAGSGTAGSGPRATCGDVCDTRAELTCAGETDAKCQSDCTYYTALFPWCEDLAADALDCIGHEPKESFSCEDTGVPLKVKQNVCAPEIAGVSQCYYEGPPEGLPDLTSECQAVCDATKSLPCAPADCLNTCAKGLADEAACNGANAGYVKCAAGQPAESWECDTQMPAAPKLKGVTCAEYIYIVLLCPS